MSLWKILPCHYTPSLYYDGTVAVPVWFTEDTPRYLFNSPSHGIVCVRPDASKKAPGVPGWKDNATGTVLKLMPTLYGGGTWFSDGNHAIFTSALGGKTIYHRASSGAPVEPNAYTDLNGIVTGDYPWYEFDSTESQSTLMVFREAGPEASGGVKTFSFFWPRWVRAGTGSGFAGEYTPVDGETGTFTIGAPTWTRSNGKVLIRRTVKTINDRKHFHYETEDGSIRLDDMGSGKFVFSDTGWYIEATSTKLEYRAYPVYEDVGGTPAGRGTLQFSGIRLSKPTTASEPIYMGEAPLWRW